jgi:lipopolysaccharide export system permease protein
MFLINHIDKLVGKGLGLGVILELITTNIASMVVMAAPMSVLVSTLMAYGGLATDHEFAAASAAGVSPFRLIMPVAIVGLFLSFATAWFSNQVLPDLNYKAGNLFLDIRKAKPGFELQENTFYDGIRGYTFLVRRFSAEQDTLYDVTLFQDASGQKKEAVIDAEWATLNAEGNGEILTMRLYDGLVRRFFITRPDNINTVERTRFSRHTLSFDVSDLTFTKGASSRQRTERSTKAQEMLVYSDSLSSSIKKSVQNFHNINRRGLGHDMLADSLKKKVLADTLLPNELIGSLPPEPAKKVRFQDIYEEFNTDSLLFAYQLIGPHPMEVSILSAAKNSSNALVNTLYDLESNIGFKMRRKAAYDVEIHKKITIPLACFIFVFIGAGIGLLTRHGNIGFAAVVSTVILTYYWIATLQGEKFADRLVIEPWIGTWFANLSMSIAAISLMLWLQQPWKKAKSLAGPTK